jgi:AmmeMemoRadiSam system protein B
MYTVERQPIVAGQFYEANPSKLKERINWCFNSGFGPKKLPEEKSRNYFAAIVPHAGYPYSCPCAAYAYKEIGEIRDIDTFVIIGTNHTGVGPSVSVFPEGVWITPFGYVDVDDEFSRELVNISNFAQLDTRAHEYEHSIEVQIPFLQFLFKNFKIVPIVFRGDEILEEARDLANSIEEAANKLGRKIFVIASSDFTHYGRHYGYVPFFGSNEEIRKKIYELDKKAIDEIVNLHEMKFLRYVHKTGATICGFAPIIATMMYAKKHIKSGKLLKYYCSGDISGDYENCVGYASIIF